MGLTGCFETSGNIY